MSQFAVVPQGALNGTPLNPGLLSQTLVAFYRYDAGVGWVFVSNDFPPIGEYPPGFFIQVVAGNPSAYIVVLARSDPNLGLGVVPTPGQLGAFYRVDMPSTPGSTPVGPGIALVGTWKQDVTSATGWAFDSWRTDQWDYAPDGHNVVTGLGGSVALELVFARTDPEGAEIGIPLNNVAGTLPTVVAQPQPQGGGGGGGGETDEIGACCANIVNALNALVTATQAIAGIEASKGEGGQGVADCCKNVVAAIKTVAEGIADIVKELPNLAGKVVDLAGVVRALDGVREGLASALQALPSGYQSQTDELVAAIRSLAPAAEPPEDCVCQVLKASIPPQRDELAMVRQLTAYLVENFGLDSGAGQIVAG